MAPCVGRGRGHHLTLSNLPLIVSVRTVASVTRMLSFSSQSVAIWSWNSACKERIICSNWNTSVRLSANEIIVFGAHLSYTYVHMQQMLKLKKKMFITLSIRSASLDWAISRFTSRNARRPSMRRRALFKVLMYLQLSSSCVRRHFFSSTRSFNSAMSENRCLCNG